MESLPDNSPTDAAINPAQSLEYWESVSADTNGMLGGFPQISRIDLQGSSNFLTKLRRRGMKATTEAAAKQPLQMMLKAADCGAGIGRVTTGLLMGVARKTDIVEPVKKFTDTLVAAESGRDGDQKEKEKGQVGEIINVGLVDWIPEPGTYDLMWHQWVLSHLTDAQIVEYMQRCKEGLVQKSDEKEDGSGSDNSGGSWIIVKENMSTDIFKKDIFDEEDSSITRSDEKYRTLFKEAGLKIVATELQRGFPRELFPVRMYALQPE